MVYRGGLENRCAVRHPGFESRPLRSLPKGNGPELVEGPNGWCEEENLLWFALRATASENLSITRNREGFVSQKFRVLIYKAL